MKIEQLYNVALLNEIFEGIPHRRIAEIAGIDPMSVRRILLTGNDTKISTLHRIVFAANAIKEEMGMPGITIGQLFDFDNGIKTQEKINKNPKKRQSTAKKAVRTRAAKKAAERIRAPHGIQIM